ncbi:MAG TPA: diacylglycerol kinase family protein [Gemmatimonadaceae bacterium]
MTNASRIPAFVNPESGNGGKARDALERAGLFDVIEVAPADLEEKIQETVENGVPRILIAGGDGSIRTAVEKVAGTGVEMAVLPSGTLNHFAKDHRLPLDLDEAAQVAGGPFTITTDVGRVGEHLFHGTSSIGAYVIFMRTRERLEKSFGYKISSFLSLVWTFIRMPTIVVELEVEGAKRTFRTPLLFVAVGERELKAPTLGGRIPDGRRSLHVMAVRGRRRARLFLVALDAFSNGVREASRSPEFDAFLVDRCSITMRRKRVRISFDGEAQTADVPLEYEFEKDMLKLVVQDPALAGKESDKPR